MRFLRLNRRAQARARARAALRKYLEILEKEGKKQREERGKE